MNRSARRFFPMVFVSTLLLNWSMSGCSPRRIESKKTFEGPPVMALMTQLGQSLEALTPPEGGEGRVINEVQNLWHYLRVSPTTTLTLTRSQYSGWSEKTETVIAEFKSPSLGSILINAQDNDVKARNGVDSGHIMFVESVDVPVPGTAKAEIYPFPQVYSGEQLPPSLQMTFPTGSVLPEGSNTDPRKKYMHDSRAIATLQEVIKGVFNEAQQKVSLPGEKAVSQ